MTTLLLDTNALYWWSAMPQRLSKTASNAIGNAEELAVAAITWFELAWLAEHRRIALTTPVRSWLHGLSQQVRTIAATTNIAATAASLPRSFPGDPADRLIYATAIEHGWQLVTIDEEMRRHRHPRKITIW